VSPKSCVWEVFLSHELVAFAVMIQLHRVLPEGDFRILGVQPLLAEDDVDVSQVHDAECEQVVVGLDAQRDALHLPVPELVGAVREVDDVGVQRGGLEVQRLHDLGADEVVGASRIDEHHHLLGHHSAPQLHMLPALEGIFRALVLDVRELHHPCRWLLDAITACEVRRVRLHGQHACRSGRGRLRAATGSRGHRRLHPGDRFYVLP
jgi:hypothetical protein